MAHDFQKHFETHKTQHIGWLRAAVLGANDGIVSTASLLVGVAAANSSSQQILLTGIAGLVAGAMSMAAGEYVSVSSQADTEKADLAREGEELKNNRAHEHEELAYIYIGRGLDPALANEVAKQLMEHDDIGSHARDELGITEGSMARPLQAALSSAVTFAVGAALPIMAAVIAPAGSVILIVFLTSLVVLILLGMLAAKVGGSIVWKSVLRIVFWGSSAMALTAMIGKLAGVAA